MVAMDHGARWSQCVVVVMVMACGGDVMVVMVVAVCGSGCGRGM